MPQCKYCRRQYENSEWTHSGMRRSEIPSSVCPSCYYGVESVKDMGRTAIDLGKKAGTAIMSFFEERKKRQKEPSGKPRIRSTNEDGYDDILSLTDIQWIILSERQLKTVRNRINEGLNDVPLEVVVRHSKEVARRYKNVEAMLLVAEWYRDGKKGVDRDYTEAFKWYNEAAKQFDPVGLLWVGVFYDRGQGVKKNQKKAFEYYHLAAMKKNRVACFNLGQCFSNGEGVERSDASAFEWWLKSAELDFVDAQVRVANCYWDGVGVEKSDESAFKWWNKAADQGHAESMNNVGVMLYKGIGVKQDTKKARELLLSVAQNGEDKAKEHLLEYFGIKS